MVGPFGVALVTMALVTGLLIMIAGALGALPRGERWSLEDVEYVPLRFVLGGVGLFGVYALTEWPVAAAYCGLSGFLVPTMATAKRKRKATIERIEAIAVWAESLRDTMAASAGIQQALRASAQVAPAPIRTEVRDLALRLQHESVSSALRRFAVDMRHPLSDMVVASLVLASARHAGSLQGVLAMTARAARDSASMWRHIEAGRARVYGQSRIAGWVSFIMIAVFVLTRREFLSPFDSIGGQIALFFICTAFFGAGVSLYRLGRPGEPRRIFGGIETWSAEAPAPQGRAI